MARLDHREVVVVGGQHARELAPARFGSAAARDQLVEVGAPAIEVVVAVYRDDARWLEAPLERGSVVRGTLRRGPELLAAFEVERVDEIDEEERCPGAASPRFAGRAPTAGALRHFLDF